MTKWYPLSCIAQNVRLDEGKSFFITDKLSDSFDLDDQNFDIILVMKEEALTGST